MTNYQKALIQFRDELYRLENDTEEITVSEIVDIFIDVLIDNGVELRDGD